ncbi:MAG: NCS2 family permease [Planctomycetota bacterium]|jgi:AGZA family xanthine/uracil permease-like MFS transporter
MVGKFFGLREKQTSVKIEFVAGVTTFLTMAYIIFVNPNILSDKTGMDKEALIAVTCIATAIATLIVGVFAKAPIAMAPGMGLNAFFAYLVGSGKMDWQTALGVVFLSGLFFLILTLLGLRKRIVGAIPASLISAIAVGIGLFITFIGLKNLGIVVKDENTFVSAGPLTLTVLIGLFGLLVMIFFEMKKITGGLIIGILTSTALAAIFKKIEMPQQFISLHLNVLKISFQLNILGALKWGFFGSIFTLMFIDMFDSVGTLVACCHQANMVDENNRIKGLDRLLGIDAIATMIGAVLGTSTTTAYIESAAGIEQGGRTGLTSIVTGVLFLLALLFVPIVGIVPEYATAPALIMVGLFMMKEVKKIDFANLEEAFPAFIIMVMIALSYRISTGLAFGFISFALIKIVSGKAKEIRAAMWVIAILSILFLTLDRLPNIIEYVKSLV